jgi:hypothetical protein
VVDCTEPTLLALCFHVIHRCTVHVFRCRYSRISTTRIITGKATMVQNLLASSAGAAASLIACQPMDVIKTRIQHRSPTSTETGWELVRALLQREGAAGFLKGLPIKLTVVSGPCDRAVGISVGWIL